ncbi:hypothetical protein V6N13_053976 [Hibiscus sabdariffa]
MAEFLSMSLPLPQWLTANLRANGRHIGRSATGVADNLVDALRGHEPGEICHESEPIGSHGGLLMGDLHRATGVG